MDKPLVELRNVSFAAQGSRIVEDISLSLAEGTATALAGPSGGGKSTVLKLAAGILVPDRGEVCYRGQNIAAFTRGQNLDFRKETAVVFQDSALWANQTLYQTLELPLRIHYPLMNREERDQRIREMVSEVGYRRDLAVRPALLSMGEQKLIGFARAMLCRPAVLFLDEWTESLDEEAVLRLSALARRFKSEGNTLVFISHDFDLVSNLSDCVIMITGGKVSANVSRDELVRNKKVAGLIEEGMNE
ncbi:MAG: ATP-binding cassette domain-containing protein [Spirochaetaceae bacterium]|jgi:ABC-type multidrug transport system ATPase subunit|nr:ATP-binding cassette domain-containing protein [Spirochaetaceae bacterium]